MNMRCSIEPKGEIDQKSGEFWVKNPFEMLNGNHNFSAYESNKFFLNRRDGKFVDLSFESGADIDSDSRSVISADFDRDGDQDILVASVGGGPLRLFRNDIPSDHHRLRVDLVGVESNRFGIGAQLTATIGDETITRDIFPVNGFMGQSPVECIVGVGAASQIDRLEIRWPTGKTQTFNSVPVDCVIQITENSEEFSVQSDDWLPAFP